MMNHSELMKNGFRFYFSRGDAERNRLLYQKVVLDGKLKHLYSINIWMYAIRSDGVETFEADVQFTSQHGEVYNVTLLDPKSVNAVEAFFHSSWMMMNPVPYGE
jgi:hypothetical protein